MSSRLGKGATALFDPACRMANLIYSGKLYECTSYNNNDCIEKLRQDSGFAWPWVKSRFIGKLHYKGPKDAVLNCLVMLPRTQPCKLTLSTPSVPKGLYSCLSYPRARPLHR